MVSRPRRNADAANSMIGSSGRERGIRLLCKDGLQRWDVPTHERPKPFIAYQVPQQRLGVVAHESVDIQLLRRLRPISWTIKDEAQDAVFVGRQAKIHAVQRTPHPRSSTRIHC